MQKLSLKTFNFIHPHSIISKAKFWAQAKQNSMFTVSGRLGMKTGYWFNCFLCILEYEEADIAAFLVFQTTDAE